MALEFEIHRWKGFRKALATEEDRDAFEEMMDICRNNSMASGNACNPVIFEPMVMSILLAHQKKLTELGYKFNDVQWHQISAQAKSKSEPTNQK
jgi:hypothetical protein